MAEPDAERRVWGGLERPRYEVSKSGKKRETQRKDRGAAFLVSGEVSAVTVPDARSLGVGTRPPGRAGAVSRKWVSSLL